MRNLKTFASLATLVPVPCLLLSLVHGGLWAFVGLLYMTFFAFLVDESVQTDDGNSSPVSHIDNFIGAVVPLVQGLSHLMLLPLVIFVTATGTGFGPVEFVLIFMAFSLYFGTFSISNAHEMIHRSGRLHHFLGKWVFISLLFGHHVTAHLAVHHRFVATDKDPNSARLDESFHRFFRRAWQGSFWAGLQVENERLRLLGRRAMHPANPYFIYLIGAVVLLGLAGAVAGLTGVLIYVALAFFAQLQLLLSDYVQHYGLRRHKLAGRQVEPVSARHSWNAPHWFSSLMMVHAPRHSDHHTHPAKTYPALLCMPKSDAPRLPYSIPVMSCLALVPVLWRRVMNPRVALWQNQS